MTNQYHIGYSERSRGLHAMLNLLRWSCIAVSFCTVSYAQAIFGDQFVFPPVSNIVLDAQSEHVRAMLDLPDGFQDNCGLNVDVFQRHNASDDAFTLLFSSCLEPSWRATVPSNPHLIDIPLNAFYDWQTLFAHGLPSWPFFTIGSIFDSDGDRLSDARETLVALTDPDSVDTDSDGINDWEEGVVGTDATTMDTDGDGIVDGFDVFGAFATTNTVKWMDCTDGEDITGYFEDLNCGSLDVDLPFPVMFGGVAYSNASINVNGVVGLSSTNMGIGLGYDGARDLHGHLGVLPRPVWIAGFWDDLELFPDALGSSVRMADFQDGMTRGFAIEFSNMGFRGHGVSGGTVSFQIIFTEGSNDRVDVVFKNPSTRGDGRYASLGVVIPGKTAQFSHRRALVQDGLCVSYFLAGDAPTTNIPTAPTELKIIDIAFSTTGAPEIISQSERIRIAVTLSTEWEWGGINPYLRPALTFLIGTQSGLAARTAQWAGGDESGGTLVFEYAPQSGDYAAGVGINGGASNMSRRAVIIPAGLEIRTVGGIGAACLQGAAQWNDLDFHNKVNMHPEHMLISVNMCAIEADESSANGVVIPLGGTAEVIVKRPDAARNNMFPLRLICSIADTLAAHVSTNQSPSVQFYGTADMAGADVSFFVTGLNAGATTLAVHDAYHVDERVEIPIIVVPAIHPRAITVAMPDPPPWVEDAEGSTHLIYVSFSQVPLAPVRLVVAKSGDDSDKFECGAELAFEAGPGFNALPVKALDGPASAGITLSDPAGRYDPVSFTVSASNSPPRILLPAPDHAHAASAGVPYSYPLLADDPASTNDPLSYSWRVAGMDGWRSGWDFSHTFTNEGQAIVEWRCDDGDGGTTFAEFTVDVRAPWSMSLEVPSSFGSLNNLGSGAINVVDACAVWADGAGSAIIFGEEMPGSPLLLSAAPDPGSYLFAWLADAGLAETYQYMPAWTARAAVDVERSGITVRHLFSKEWEPMAGLDGFGDADQDGLSDSYESTYESISGHDMNGDIGAAACTVPYGDNGADGNPDGDFLPPADFSVVTNRADGGFIRVYAYPLPLKASGYLPDASRPFSNIIEFRGLEEDRGDGVFRRYAGLWHPGGDWEDPLRGDQPMTNPRLADSDGDSIFDGWEYYFRQAILYDVGTNAMRRWNAPHSSLFTPAASPLSEYGEIGLLQHFSKEHLLAVFDPWQPDSSHSDVDNDGLENWEECAFGLNPLHWDTDGDGIPDGIEVYHGLDPLDGATQDADSDSDGLGDYDEILLGSDPSQPDSDGDGLSDGWEFLNGLDPLTNNGGDADPANDASADPDGDGMENAEESDYGTAPMDADTDGDGVPDGWEVLHGTDPLDPDDTPPIDDLPPGFANAPPAPDAEPPPGVCAAIVVFGDHSGSHSEKYTLEIKPLFGDARPNFKRLNHNYGETESVGYSLKTGAVYIVTLSHAGTEPDVDTPDYDYTLAVSVDGAMVQDDYGILGVHDESDPFFAEGKYAVITVGDVALPEPSGEDPNPDASNANCGDPVNVISGGMNFSVTDISVSAPGIPLAFTRHYNSASIASVPGMPPGWSHNYAYALSSESYCSHKGAAAFYRHISFPDGRKLAFKRVGLANEFFTAAGSGGGVLEKTDDGWLARFPDASCILFGDDGLPLSINDGLGNSLTLRHTSGRITRATHSNGASISMAYSHYYYPKPVPRMVSCMYSVSSSASAYRVSLTHKHLGTVPYIGMVKHFGMDGAELKRESYMYEAAGLITNRVSSSGVSYSHSYADIVDVRGAVARRVVESWVGEDDFRDSFEYFPDGNGNQTRVTFHRSAAETVSKLYTWDDATRLITSVLNENDGSETSTSYDDAQNPVAVSFLESGVRRGGVRNVFDGRGNAISSAEALDSEPLLSSPRRAAYHPLYAFQVSVSDEAGVTVSNIFDGPLLSSSSLLGASGDAPLATHFSYAADGLPASVTLPGGGRTEFEWNASGLPVSVSNAALRATYEYDVYGALAFSVRRGAQNRAFHKRRFRAPAFRNHPWSWDGALYPLRFRRRDIVCRPRGQSRGHRALCCARLPRVGDFVAWRHARSRFMVSRLAAEHAFGV